MFKLLSKTEVNRYHDEGFLFPVSIFNQREVTSFRDSFYELENALGSKTKAQYRSATHLHFAWAYQLVTHPRILDAVEDIIGPNLIVHSTSIFYKKPGDGQFVSWHQDGYYWNLNEPALVTAWVALSDSTLENGCLRVVKGSHRRGIVRHNTGASTPKNILGSGLQVETEVDSDKVRNLLLKPGEMSLHHTDIIHGSSPNNSLIPRIGFVIRYMAPEVSQTYPHYEVVLARGQDSFGHYKIKSELPSGSFEDQFQAHINFIEALKIKRANMGRPNG